MKRVLFIGVAVFLLCTRAFALQCVAQAESYKIIFGNGILTTLEGANSSRLELEKNIGSSYMGQIIAYDLAYNYSGGAFYDLLQALDQQVTQYTSQVWSWMYSVGVVPDWYYALIQSLLLKQYSFNAFELPTHVEKYKEAILQGQKVLVVSHSQGNFYVNQAKQMMTNISPAVPMSSFGVFGVASPANNVGGTGGPYLTNHRDVILMVPGSLPANWNLQYANNLTLASDRDRVMAHSFVDTYMNHKFDIAPAVIQGIKSKLASLQDPPQW